MPSSKNRTRRRKRHTGIVQRYFSHIMRFILSPAVILWDTFRQKRNLDPSWVFSLLLLITVMLALAGLSFWVAGGPAERAMTVLSSAHMQSHQLTGDVQPIIREINRYALKEKLDPMLVFAIIKAESNFNPRAVSKAGARGLMQIMPSVWQEYSKSQCTGTHSNLKVCSEDCIYEIAPNIEVGVKYFRKLLDRYDGRIDLALEAYNAGLSNVQSDSEPKFKETRSYIQKTLTYWQELRQKAIAVQLQTSLYMHRGIKWLLGITFIMWLVFFGWVNRKILSK
ncbi:MAG TPA: lytic transglycosylase domain-containing protein [Bacillota bacterium]|nr:lytic transglycosylase domain-containing protein [Bacillota bacterium]HPT88698.1 lytic transglycosylase domain-containing protein [Bacillota bacterium]